MSNHNLGRRKPNDFIGGIADIDTLNEAHVRVGMMILSLESPAPVIQRKIKERKYHYFITLTSTLSFTDEIDSDLEKIVYSKTFGIIRYTIGRELQNNGNPHYHLCVESRLPIYISDIRKLTDRHRDRENRIECKLLRTPKDVLKVMMYVRKGERNPKKSDLEYFSKLHMDLVQDVTL